LKLVFVSAAVGHPADPSFTDSPECSTSVAVRLALALRPRCTPLPGRPAAPALRCTSRFRWLTLPEVWRSRRTFERCSSSGRSTFIYGLNLAVKCESRSRSCVLHQRRGNCCWSPTPSSIRTTRQIVRGAVARGSRNRKTKGNYQKQEITNIHWPIFTLVLQATPEVATDLTG